MLTRQLDFLTSLEAPEPLDPNIIQFGDNRWDAALDYWKNSTIFGFDLETYGEKEDALDPWKGHIRLVSIGLDNGCSILADLGGWADDRASTQQLLTHVGFLPRLKERLANGKVLKVGQNLKFDQLWMLVKFGYKTRTIRDTELMSRVYWAGIPQYKHGLGAIASRVLGVNLDKSEQKSNFGWELTNSQRNYAASDAQVVLKIYHRLWSQLEAANLKGQAIAECGASPAFTQMEFVGMPVDEELLHRVLHQYKGAEAGVLKPFSDEFPGINPGSPSQVKVAIESKFGISIGTTGAENLSQHFDIPAIKALSLWRSLSKSIEYLEIVKTHMFDGAVRGKYMQIAPKGFGRSTCSKPNLQNPPNPNNLPPELKALGLPPVRSIFRAPTGKKLIVADLSQAHARIAAEASRDKTLLDAYNQDLDVHCLTASKLAQLQGLDWSADDVNKLRGDKTSPHRQKATKLRQAAKPTFYGSLNGQGWKTLQITARTDAGVEMTDEEAKQAIEAWRSVYSGLYGFQKKINADANCTNQTFPGVVGEWAQVRGLSGRRIFMQKQRWENEAPKVKFTDAVSFYWTSTEADIVKLAMAGCLASFDQHPEWEASLTNCAHDELDVTCNEQYAGVVAKSVWIWLTAGMKMFIKKIPVDEPGSDFRKMICQSWDEK